MSDPTPTSIDEGERPFLTLKVEATRSDSAAANANSTRWCAEVCDPASPIAGLHSFGESLSASCDALATLAWAAVLAGELRRDGIDASSVVGVCVVVTACEAVYDAAWLNTAVTNDAA